MGQIHVILQAMKSDRVYSANDLALQTHYRPQEIGRALNLLVKGGLIERVGVDTVKKKKGKPKYRTKQQQLPL